VSESAHPTRDWLAFARTTTARTKIRRYLKTYEREVNLQLGRERLDVALKAVGASGLGAVRDEDLLRFNTNKRYNTPDDLYVALGREDLPVGAVLEYLTPLMQKRGEIKPETESVKMDTITIAMGNMSHLRRLSNWQIAVALFLVIQLWVF